MAFLPKSMEKMKSINSLVELILYSSPQHKYRRQFESRQRSTHSYKISELNHKFRVPIILQAIDPLF